VISTTDFKKGVRVLLDGAPYALDEFSVQSPSARGAATLVRCKFRHLVTGALLDKTFKAGEKFEEPDVAFRQIQFLYDDGEACHFMDIQSYEQFALPDETLGDIVPWLREGMQLNAVVWNGHPAGVNLPQYVEAEIDMVGGGRSSDMASGKTLKDANLKNGLTIKVPLFIESGETVLVDPRTREFIRRAKGGVRP
jgi:elongation factor P